MKKYGLVLRVCSKDMTSHNNFKWPESGMVECPDWQAIEECGNGLHGWLYGVGDYTAANVEQDSKWLVVKVLLSDVIDLGGKVKFPRCEVVFCGDKKGATDYLVKKEAAAKGKAVIGATVAVGDNEMAMVGALGYAVGGDGSTLTGGHDSKLTGGHCSTLTGGKRSTLTGGHYSTLTGGIHSTLTGGDYSTLTGGHNSMLTGGCNSELRIGYYDQESKRWRTAIAYVGEDGIEPNVAYRLNEKHKFVKVD